MVFGLSVDTSRKPLTLVPAGPAGVIVTAIVPDSPGPRTRGENGGADESTESSQTSPVSEVIARSNAFISAVAVMSAVAAGGPPLPNGPTSAGEPNQTPGAIAGSARCAVAIEPAGTAGTSDAPNWSDIVIPIGTVLLATTVNASAWVGTNHAGRGSPLPSGSGTVVGLNASTGKSTSCGSRASTKTTFSLTPVLVTCTVTTTGCPAVRRADFEFGRL